QFPCGGGIGRPCSQFFSVGEIRFNGVAFFRSQPVLVRAFILLLLVCALCPPLAVAAGLTLSGTPPTSAVVGKQYSFQPSVSGTTNTVTYWIWHKPSWATFSSTTGRLSGVPTQAGSYSDIVIRVSTGYFNASLPAFAI